MSEIELGELFFCAEDFNYRDEGEDWAKYCQSTAIEIAEDANRLLRERLSKLDVLEQDEDFIYFRIKKHVACREGE